MGFAMRAKAAYIYVRGEFWHEGNCLQKAVDEVNYGSRRHTQRVFWGRMPVGVGTILMFTFILGRGPISVARRRD